MYPSTIAAIRVRANRAEEDRANHLLWMCAEVEKMDDALKQSRWIGWMLREAEVLGWWDNEVSRDLIRVDVTEGT